METPWLPIAAQAVGDMVGYMLEFPTSWQIIYQYKKLVIQSHADQPPVWGRQMSPSIRCRKIIRQPKKRNLISKELYDSISIDDELKFLYLDIVEFIYPRLLKFRDNVGMGKPCGIVDREKWIIILDEIIWFMHNIRKTKDFSPIHFDDLYRFNEAHLLFQRYFFELQL